jgi:DNA-binding MarR family transcriptional regulator
VVALRVLARLARMLDTVDSGLTLPQYRILAVIAIGGVRSAILAERLSVRRPTLTAIVDGLVAAGYARREAEAGDRRVVNVYATDAGRAVLAQADEAYLARLAPILVDMPDADRFVADLLSVGDALDARMQARLEPAPAELRPAERQPAELRPAELRPAELQAAELRPADAGRTHSSKETTEAAL